MLILTALRTQIKWILAMFIIVFTASIAFMYGTGRSGGDGRSGDYVVARVDGDELHISQLQEHVRSFVERHGIRDLSDTQIPLIYKAAFDEMVSNRAVIKEVERLKITAPLEDVNTQLKALENQYVTKEAFYQAIKQQGHTLDQVKAEISRELSIRKMLDDVSGGETVADEEVEALYSALRGNFTLPAGIEVDFAHLKTKESAEKLAAAVKANGDWDAAVESVKDDIVQSTKGGEHERIAATEMAGKLEPLAALTDGQVCEPIELTSQDYLVMRRTTAVPEQVRPLSEVSDSIRNMILQSKKIDTQEKYIKDLAAKMDVEILTPDIFAVPETTGDPLAASGMSTPAASAETEVAPAETPAAPAETPAEAPAEPAPAQAPAAQPAPEVTTVTTPAPAEAPAATETPTVGATTETAAEAAPAETVEAAPAEAPAATENPAAAETTTEPAVEAVPAETVEAAPASAPAATEAPAAAEATTEPAAEAAPAEATVTTEQSAN